MISIKIKQSGSSKFSVRENVVTKRTPTQYVEDSDYGNKKKVVFADEFAIQEVEKVKEWESTLLEQNIVDDADFDLAAVIKAINKL